MFDEFISVRNEVANHRFDKVECDKYDKPLRVNGTERTKDGTRVSAEELIDGEIVKEQFLFPRDNDTADVIRPRELCFSSTGDEKRDRMFDAFVSGYYEADKSPTVDGYELYESLAERFRQQH